MAARRLLILPAALLLLALAPSGAAAEDVSREQAAELAATADTDPAALARLEGVTSIDGRSANPAGALDGASGEPLEQRLAALETALGGADAGDADRDAARVRAQEILDDFEEQVETIPPEETDESDGAGTSLDIGSLWLPLLIAAVVIGLILAIYLARNRERKGRLAAEAELDDPPAPVSELERLASEAERSGDWEQALRLRYGIALRALQESGAVPPGPSVTPGGVSRRLGHPRAGTLVETFERVVYGRRKAGAADAHEARDGWPAVVGETTSAQEAAARDAAAAKAETGSQA